MPSLTGISSTTPLALLLIWMSWAATIVPVAVTGITRSSRCAFSRTPSRNDSPSDGRPVMLTVIMPPTTTTSTDKMAMCLPFMSDSKTFAASAAGSSVPAERARFA